MEHIVYIDSYLLSTQSNSSTIHPDSLRDLVQSVRTHCRPYGAPVLQKAALPHNVLQSASLGQNVPFSAISHLRLPTSSAKLIDAYPRSCYGGQFVADGQYFITSSQEPALRIYETFHSDNVADWKRIKFIPAMGISWTITDFAYSPCKRFLAYSSIDSIIHVASLEGDAHMQRSFHMGRLGTSTRSVRVWSLSWSHDSKTIIAGASDDGDRSGRGVLIMLNVETAEVTHSGLGHDDDVNAVAWLNHDCFVSGADDSLVMLWDRRVLGKRGERPSVLAGHTYGVTSVDCKSDGRYVVSNSKDQSIKVWDARKTISLNQALDHVASMRKCARKFDYRKSACPRFNKGRFDGAVQTFRGGHETLQTLIRAYFSPMRSTGERYVYCGSSDGRCAVYDLEKGELVAVVCTRAVVRDVAWAPWGGGLVTSDWNGNVKWWQNGFLKEDNEDLRRSARRIITRGYHPITWLL